MNRSGLRSTEETHVAFLVQAVFEACSFTGLKPNEASEFAGQISPTLLSIVYAQVRRHEDREQVIGEMGFKFVRGARGVAWIWPSDEPRMAGWFKTVTRNQCVSLFRAQKNDPHVTGSEWGAVASPVSDTETKEELRSTIDSVCTPSDRALISALRAAQDHSQAAAQLGMSEGTFNVRLYRLRHKLRTILRDDA